MTEVIGTLLNTVKYSYEIPLGSLNIIFSDEN
jgi:hypothetical protein